MNESKLITNKYRANLILLFCQVSMKHPLIGSLCVLDKIISKTPDTASVFSNPTWFISASFKLH